MEWKIADSLHQKIIFFKKTKLFSDFSQAQIKKKEAKILALK
jgi:hypothetical protein